MLTYIILMRLGKIFVRYRSIVADFSGGLFFLGLYHM